MCLYTQAKTKELKTTLNTEFRLIHELCVFVLCNTRKQELIRATLDTLSVYLTWVPLGYIFESNLLNILLQLFPQPAYRNVALQCLTEVRSRASRQPRGLGSWSGHPQTVPRCSMRASSFPSDKHRPTVLASLGPRT